MIKEWIRSDYRKRPFPLAYNNVKVVDRKVVEFDMLLVNRDCKVGLVALRSTWLRDVATFRLYSLIDKFDLVMAAGFAFYPPTGCSCNG